MPTSGQGGHSADVKMHLLLRGNSIPVAQLGPDFLLLETANEQSPGEASLALRANRSKASLAPHSFEMASACGASKGLTGVPLFATGWAW